MAFSLALIAANAACETTSAAAPAFTPLNDFAAEKYLDQFQGGLYPGGANVMPAAHDAAGLAMAQQVLPRNGAGVSNGDGRYALLSIGISNTTQEFFGANSPLGPSTYSFMGQAAAHPSVNHDQLVIVNGAQGSKSAAFWDSPDDADYDRVRDNVLAPQGLSELQVAAAWVKVANPGPNVSLPAANADAYQLVRQIGDIARSLKTRYPNMGQVYLSSRIYAGYAASTLNPEPYAYESGFAVKWLIEAQINQMQGGGVDPLAGDLNYLDGTAPWLAWGPYLWADGLNPRSDGLTWEQDDFSSDGTHPSETGREKVGGALLDFFLSDPRAQPWFLSATAGDFDNDDDMDGQDFLVWQRAESPHPLSSSDLAAWRARFGSTSIVATATAVPEPGFIMLAPLALLSCWWLGGRVKHNDA